MSTRLQFSKERILLFFLILLTPFAILNASRANPPSPSTADWQTYKNSEFNFSVRHPKSWRAVVCCTEIDPITRHHSGMGYDAFEKKGPPLQGVTGAGKKVLVDNYVTQWAIYNYPQSRATMPVEPQKTIDMLISSLTNRFKDRKIETSQMSIAGRNARRVILKKSSGSIEPDEYIMLVDRKNVFVLHNVNGTAASFNEFCKSLTFQ